MCSGGWGGFLSDRSIVGTRQRSLSSLFGFSRQPIFPLTQFQHQPPATSQPTVFFSHTTLALATSTSTANRVVVVIFFHSSLFSCKLPPLELHRSCSGSSCWRASAAAPADQRCLRPRLALSALLSRCEQVRGRSPTPAGLENKGFGGGRPARRWGWREGGFRVLEAGEAAGPGRGGAGRS